MEKIEAWRMILRSLDLRIVPVPKVIINGELYSVDGERGLFVNVATGQCFEGGHPLITELRFPISESVTLGVQGDTNAGGN